MNKLIFLSSIICFLFTGCATVHSTPNQLRRGRDVIERSCKIHDGVDVVLELPQHQLIIGICKDGTAIAYRWVIIEGEDGIKDKKLIPLEVRYDNKQLEAWRMSYD